MKQHAIIEKTARFISSQGVQMEILLKAKQSNNSQFEFLTQNSELYSYYKFILDAVKNGAYPAEEVAKDNSNGHNLGKEQEDISKNIHEKASVAIDNKPIIPVPTIKYKPSANCAYTQLISKIKGVPLPQVIDEHRRSFSPSDGTKHTATINTLTVDASVGDNSTPVLLQYSSQNCITEKTDELSHTQKCHANANSPPKVEILNNSCALRLAQNYSSNSDSESDSEDKLKKLTFPIPPKNLRNIIDKTASYVIKNGRQFEETLRSKSEERFTFLLQDNEFYPYYMYKITGDPDAASLEQKTKRAAAVAAALMTKRKFQSNLGTHVSFSIKSKEDQLQPALPQEVSDEEDSHYSNHDKQPQSKRYFHSDIQQRTVPEHVKRAIQLVESQLMARNAQIAAVIGAASCSTVMPGCNMRSRFDLDYNGRSVKPPGSNMSSAAEMQRNAIYEQQQQNRHKELKRAEEKVKDKLAQIAREKLGGLISKEKQLQLERKRKAMAFLNQIKGTSENKLTPEKNRRVDHGNGSDNSETSVHSIPITSYGPEEKTDDEGELHYPPPLPIPGTLDTPAGVQKLSSVPKSDSNINFKHAEVILSDDDDVQLISETKPQQSSVAIFSIRRKRSKHENRQNVRSRSHSRSHSHSHTHDFQPSTRKRINHRVYEFSISSDESPEMSHRAKKRSRKFHKAKKSKKNRAKKSKTKSKSKKRRRSQSRSSYSSKNSPYCRRSESHASSHFRQSTLRESHSYYSRSDSEQLEVTSPVPSSKRYREYVKHNQRLHTPKRREKHRKHEHLH